MKGSVFFQKDRGRYAVSFWLNGRNHTATRYKGEFCYHEKIANKLLALIQNRFEQAQQGLCRFRVEEFTGKGWTDVLEYFEEWMREVIEPKRKPATIKGYWSYYRTWIKPFFEENPILLHEIQLDTLTKLLNYITLTGKGKYNVMNCFHAMMDHAWRSRRIPEVPPFPKKEDYNIIQPKIEWVDTETFWKVLNAIEEDDKPIFLWMYYHLMREAEACALQWRDWDEINRVFTVRRSISARQVVESTKTGEIYVTPCHSDFHPYMVKLQSNELHKRDEFIFTNRRARRDGKRYTNESISKAWKRACNAVGVKIRPYAGIRHSRATQMSVELGMSAYEIKEAGTWKRVDSVYRYRDLRMERKRELLERKVIPLPSSTKLLQGVNNGEKRK
jgi:integrase